MLTSWYLWISIMNIFYPSSFFILLSIHVCILAVFPPSLFLLLCTYIYLNINLWWHHMSAEKPSFIHISLSIFLFTSTFLFMLISIIILTYIFIGCTDTSQHQPLMGPHECQAVLIYTFSHFYLCLYLHSHLCSYLRFLFCWSISLLCAQIYLNINLDLWWHHMSAGQAPIYMFSISFTHNTQQQHQHILSQLQFKPNLILNSELPHPKFPSVVLLILQSVLCSI